jgi:hypothetical protein
MKSILFLYFYLYFTNAVKINSYIRFFKNKSIYSIFNDLIKIENKEPIILNGDKTPFKKDFCRYISNINNIPFKEYSFHTFMTEFPHINNDKSLLYIDDFLIGNGRILNHYEENILLNLNRNSNLIVFQSDNIQTIPFKDQLIIRRFPIIQFPEIKKKDIVQYIYDTITLYNYDPNLYTINWSIYNIDNLDFEKINILLFELDHMNKNNIDFNFLKNNINSIIDSLYNLNNFNF